MEVAEVAASLGMSKDAVRKAIKRGTMKAEVKHGGPRGGGSLGGFYVVESEEVERYRKTHLGRVLGRPAKGG